MPKQINQEKIDLLYRILVAGPIPDDAIANKKARDALVEMGYVSKIVVGGVGGLNAATHNGSGAFCRFCGRDLLVDALMHYRTGLPETTTT